MQDKTPGKAPTNAFILIIVGGLLEIGGIAAVAFGGSLLYLGLLVIGGILSILGIRQLIRRADPPSKAP